MSEEQLPVYVEWRWIVNELKAEARNYKLYEQ